jgi:DNA-binding CsgD family transcriptional regulator
LTRPRLFDHDEARRMYEEDRLSFAEIGRRLGVRSESVRNACYRNGMTRARPSTVGGPRTFDYEAARALRRQGKTYAQIGEELDVTAEAVRYACKGTPMANSSATVARIKRQDAGDADRASLMRFAQLTAHDPPIPADGSCAICGRPRRPEQSAKYAKGCAEIDAFCSSTCARKFHGTYVPPPENRGRFKAAPPEHGTSRGYRSGCSCEQCLAFERNRSQLRRLKAKEAA